MFYFRKVFYVFYLMPDAVGNIYNCLCFVRKYSILHSCFLEYDYHKNKIRIILFSPF